MATLGLTFTSNTEGECVMVQEANQIDDSMFTTALTANDLITNSHIQGYLTGELSKVLLPEGEDLLTMSTNVRRSENGEQTKQGDGGESMKTCAKLNEY